MGSCQLSADLWNWFRDDEEYKWYLHHHNAALWGPAKAMWKQME